MKNFKKRQRLAIAWKPESVSLFLFEPSRGLKYGTFRLDESPYDGLATKVKEFLEKVGRRPAFFLAGHCPTILVIPRSEVLQKEMTLERTDGFSEKLQTKVAQLLPYSPKEMAYSLAIDSSQVSAPCKGLLYAIPEQKINQILEFLAASGIAADEVVSEDQTLFWLIQDRAVGGGPVMVFDQTLERTLFLACKENAILLSRAYPPEEDFKNVLSEISFSLLEAGVKPAKAFVLGMINRQEIVKAFEIPVEPFEPESLEGVPVPSVLSGAKRWGIYPAISLLPSGQKLQKRAQKQKRLLKESLTALGIFIFCFFLAAASHLSFLKHKKAMLENEVAKLGPAVSEIRQITSSLATIHEAEHSKRRLLLFLRELAERMPSSVRLQELRVEGEGLVFQGESPSHALLTETVQIFERISGVKEAKLEHARLRKRLNQDYFEFEVTARWQN